MSGSILFFVPRDELSAAANLDSFVAVCRMSAVLNANIQFEKDVWDVGRSKGKNTMNRVIFSTLETCGRGQSNDSFQPPFLDFAKAMLVYLQDRKPVESQGPRIAALRCLEVALHQLNKGFRPTAVDSEVLDAAVAVGKEKVTASVAYRWAGQLEEISKTMHACGFITLRQPWKHGQKKPEETGTRISKEALQARQEKLPSSAVLRALGGIFRQATEAPDVRVSSFTTLMLCAPERINEVVRLRRNCFVEGEKEFLGKRGLRWPGSKGFENTTKWLPTAMGKIAFDAVRNLLKVSATAHELACWYTENPGSVYLHERAQHLRNKPVLTSSEIALLLWDDETNANSAKNWARIKHELEPLDGGRRTYVYRFKDVERAVLSQLPATFPFMPGDPELLCKDALAVMPTNSMHADKMTYVCMFATIDQGIIATHFGRQDGRSSMFERFEYTEDDGSRIELRSHSLRHYLNMLAQTGGLSSAEIAVFSGRKDEKQNRAYDHMNSEEVQAPIALALKNGFTSDLAPAQEQRNLIDRLEFRGLGIPAAHTTEYGWCRHDFASEPCQMFSDCINCEEQECVKGEAHKESNLQSRKEETEFLLARAREALDADEYGADIWVAHQNKTLERLEMLLSILRDPKLPIGARIRLDLDSTPLVTLGNAHPIKIIRRSRQKALT